MEALLEKRNFPALGLLGFAASVAATSVILVSRHGASSSGLALFSTALFGLGIFSVLACLRPLTTYVVALVLMTSPLSLMLSLPQSAVIAAFLFGAATAGFGARQRLRAIAQDPLILPIAAFAFYCAGSAAYGLVMGNEISYVLGDCFQLLEFALVYLLVGQLLRDRANLRVVLWSALTSILVTIAVELLLFIVGSDAGGLLPSWEGAGNTESLVRTIDIDATFLFTLLINLYPLVRSGKNRLYIWLALIPTAANIVLSLSRGLWLCTLIAIVVSLLLQVRQARARLVKASAYVGVGIVLLAAGLRIGLDSDTSLMDVFEDRIFHGVDQVEEGFAGTESMATRRFLEMAIVAPQVLVHPLIGHGLGATYIIAGFAVLDSGTSELIDHHFIHNLYLVTAFRMGFIGLALIFLLLIVYFRKILPAYRKMPEGMYKAMVAGLMASIVGQLFLSMTQPTIFEHPTCVLIASAMAISVRLSGFASAATGPPPQLGRLSLEDGI